MLSLKEQNELTVTKRGEGLPCGGHRSSKGLEVGGGGGGGRELTAGEKAEHWEIRD